MSNLTRRMSRASRASHDLSLLLDEPGGGWHGACNRKYLFAGPSLAGGSRGQRQRIGALDGWRARGGREVRHTGGAEMPF
jgi:hypothetical protein